MTFNLNGGTVTLNTTTTGEAGSTASNWEFRGTYQKVQWDGSASDPSDLSKTYGFAKGNATIAAGQFVHFAAGAWLKPMRCYLVYKALRRAVHSRMLPAGLAVQPLRRNCPRPSRWYL